jgi:hypothetical protein
MAVILPLLETLTESVNRFIDEYNRHDPTEKVTDEWSIKDVLCLVTYWHEYYAKNLDAEAHGKKFIFPDLTFYELNWRGILLFRPYADNKLIGMLTNAQKRLVETVLTGKVDGMTYRHGSKPYSIARFLEMITGYINGHTESLQKSKKKSDVV